MRRWLALGLLCSGLAQAAPATEVLFEDTDPGEPAYQSRLLVQGERLRLDYGRDEGDFIIYDRKARKVYQVSQEARRVTEIPATGAAVALPRGWHVELKREGRNAEIRLDGRACAKFRSAPVLTNEARLFGDFRRALAYIQAATWRATPKELRDPCVLVLEAVRPGVEYEAGLPLAIHYADGRSRVYRSHREREAEASLFELPAGYERFSLSAEVSR